MDPFTETIHAVGARQSKDRQFGKIPRLQWRLPSTVIITLTFTIQVHLPTWCFAAASRCGCEPSSMSRLQSVAKTYGSKGPQI